MKRARSTAGWLKQKSKLLTLLIVALCASFGSAVIPLAVHAASSSAYWKDDHQTLVYNSKEYTGGTGQDASFTTVTDSSHNCMSRIDFNGDYTTATKATVYSQNWIGGRENHCQWSDGTNITVDPTANNTSAGASGGSGSDESGGQVATEDPCNMTADPLSWFICPVINMISGAVSKMQSIIDNLLEFDVATVFDRNKESGQAYYTAWNSFRLVGIAVVVIAGLVMVITQALGLEVFDAYTVKKMVPRLFLAAVGISLSWYLLQFLANFTNDVGLAVRHMIYWPFRNIGDGNTGLTGAGGFLAGDLVAGGVLFTLTIGGVLSLVATAGLAALIAFLVLILRQMVLILLILLAPLAIALYVLPNTQKVYQLWWDSISKGFMMFPIIVAFIATGRVFSVVAANAGGNGIHSTINQIISLIAFFLPYFALPFTFKLAGGAIGTLAGLTNDRSRGAFDRLKNFRQQGAARKHQMRMAGQTRFGSSRAGSLYRRAASLGDPTSSAAGVTAAGRAKYREYERKLLAQHSDEMLKNDNMRAAGDDLAMELAQTSRNGRAFVDQYRTRTIADAAARGEVVSSAEATRMANNALGLTETSFGARMGTEAMQVAAFKAQQTSVTGYGDTDSEILRRYQDAGRMVQRGLMTESDAMATIKQNKGRVEASASSFGVGMSVIKSAAQGKTLDNDDLRKLMDSTLEGLTPGSLVGARREAGQIIGRHQMRQLEDTITASGGNISDERVQRVMGRIAGLRDSINAHAPQLAEGFADDLLAQTIPGTNLTVREYEEQLRASPSTSAAFHDVRKEWISGVPPGTVPGALPPAGPPGGAPGAPPSDRRLKRNIRWVAHTDRGVSLYRFQYLWSSQEYVGVMAQDLVDSHPEALEVDSFGYYRVDYEKLGLQMMTYFEWMQQCQEQRQSSKKV